MSRPQAVPFSYRESWSRSIELHDSSIEEPRAKNRSINMKTITEKSDTEIKTDVLAELKYEPSVSIADVGVLVKDGAVTLNGYATSYGEK
jgi:osmotically-inducible protein OsmY